VTWRALAGQIGKLSEQAVDGDLRLDARERAAETEEGSVAECEMMIVGPREVEPVGN